MGLRVDTGASELKEKLGRTREDLSLHWREVSASLEDVWRVMKGKASALAMEERLRRMQTTMEETNQA